jgi:hypothetical protein
MTSKLSVCDTPGTTLPVTDVEDRGRDKANPCARFV